MLLGLAQPLFKSLYWQQASVVSLLSELVRKVSIINNSTVNKTMALSIQKLIKTPF